MSVIIITHTTTSDGSFSAGGSAAWDAIHGVTGGVSKELVFGTTSGTLDSTATLTYESSARNLRVGPISLNSTAAAGPSRISIPDSPGAAASGEALSILGQPGGTASGDGGAINITSGSAVGLGDGGAITIRSGDGAGAGGQPGGPITIIGGAGSGIGAGGDVLIGGGLGSTGPNSNGGSVTLFGGFGGSVSGNGGNISIVPNDAQTSGSGGSLFLWGGLAAGVNQNGGNVNLLPGEKTGSGVQGYVTVTGAARNYLVANSTGDVTITSVRPAAVANATIQGWLPIKVDGTLYHIPLWS